MKLRKYTVPTGNRTLGRRIAVHYATAAPRMLLWLFRFGKPMIFVWCSCLIAPLCLDINQHCEEPRMLLPNTGREIVDWLFNGITSTIILSKWTIDYHWLPLIHYCLKIILNSVTINFLRSYDVYFWKCSAFFGMIFLHENCNLIINMSGWRIVIFEKVCVQWCFENTCIE